MREVNSQKRECLCQNKMNFLFFFEAYFQKFYAKYTDQDDIYDFTCIDL